MSEYVFCDECGQSFVPELKSADKDGFTLLYVGCPGCGAKYAVAVLDQGSRKMHAELNKSLAEARKGNRTEESALFRREGMRKLMARSKELLEEHPVEWFFEEGK